MITPLYHLRVLNTPGRRLLSASVVRYKQRPVDKGQGQKPEVTSDSGSKTSEKPHIKKAPGKTSMPQPPKTPNKTSGLEANKKSSDKKSSDKKDSDKKSSDKKDSDKKGSDKKGSDKKGSDKKRSDKKGSDKKRSDKKSSDKSRKTPRPEDTKKNGDTHPLERFFSQYSKFQYQPTRSPVTEFNRLRKEYGWERELAIALSEFKRATKDAMKELQHTEKNGVTQPQKSFFSRYSKFKYQPASSPITEFKRLCEEYGWEKELEDARREFDLAMKMEFDSLYGSDENDIKNWYKLCHVLRIDPAPNTLKECREAVLGKHVNLVDLVEGSRKNIPIFEWEEDLCVYTNVTGKFFPKEDAADGGVLRALRRHVLTLPDGAVLRALCHYILTSPDGRVMRALRSHVLTLPDDGISRALRRHF